MIQGQDFKLGYSPERLLPGSKKYTLEQIVKVVAAEDSGALERICAVYEKIISAGVYRAASIQVAEEIVSQTCVRYGHTAEQIG